MVLAFPAGGHHTAADWHGQYGETAAHGHSGQYYARAGAAAKAAPKFSNGVIAAVLAVPLLLSGIHLSRAYQTLNNDPFRPGGVMAPPQNPWLREDLRPTTHSGRLQFMKAWQAQRAQRKREAADAAAAKGGTQQQQGDALGVRVAAEQASPAVPLQQQQ